MTQQSRNERLEELMGELQEMMLENMRDDLNDPEKRSPQLYNAIIKELARNGIDCVPKAGDEQSNALHKLLNDVKGRFQEDYGTSLSSKN
jgi:hypothetical protein